MPLPDCKMYEKKKIVKVCPPWLGSKKDFRTSKSLFHHSENAFFFSKNKRRKGKHKQSS